MIKLYELLKEQVGQPKAIILAGAPGAGKGYVLKGLNLDIKPGEVHAIMGPNGSGKSTLANVLSGKTGYKIFYECKKCAYKHWNMMLPDDNMDAMVNLKPYHEA